MPAMKISAYTICLNEQKHVARWLEANKGADLRVIVDTGSTDATLNMLVEAQKTDPNLIVHQITVKPWRFDDARNAALSLVPPDVDVCMSVDMDEMPDPDFYDIVRRDWKPETTRGWFAFDTGSVWQANRLHTRFNYRWVAPCHEVAEWFGEGQEVSQTFNTHMKHCPDSEKSRAQYLPLLLMAVNEHPEDGRMWVYLAREYYFERNWPKVLETSAVAVALENTWNVERAYACRLAGQAAWETDHDPMPLLLEGVKHDPESLEAWYPVAFHHFINRRWKECWQAASKRLKLPETTHYLREAEVWDWRMYDLMSLSKWNLGKKKEALKWAEAALAGKPDSERLQRNMEFIRDNIAPET